ncbi:YdgA family protein [Gammaproteobacteria bacterium]|nr:YdgA family protein [Gammaproteobacteria bacterium]
MKKILGLLTIVVILGLGVPKMIGSIAVQNLENFVITINDNDLGYVARIKNLDAGWFSTTADIYFALDPTIYDAFAEVDVGVVAQHGPILTLNDWALGALAFRLETDKRTARDVLTYSEEQSLYQLEGHVNFLGTVSYFDSIPVFKYSSNESSNSSRFGGWNGRGTSSKNKTIYQGEIYSSRDMRADGRELLMTSGTVSLNAQGSMLEIISDPLLESTYQFGLGYFLYRDGSSNSDSFIEIDNTELKFFTGAGKDPSFVNLGFDFTIEGIDVDIQKLFVAKAKDLTLKTEVKNIAIEPFIELAYSDVEDPWASDSVELLALLQPSPEFNVTEISGNIVGQSFSGYLLAKYSDINSLPNKPDNILFWLSKVVIDAKMVLDKELAYWLSEKFISLSTPLSEFVEGEITSKAREEARDMIDGYMQVGILSETEGGDFEISFRLKDSEALLNGEVTPLPL